MSKKKSKKKSQKKRAREAGVDVNEKRRERLEARRAAKAEAEAAAARQERRSAWVRRTVLVLVLGGAFWLLFLRGRGPTEINGHTIETFNQAGTGQHTNESVAYETNPPVAGQHANGAAPCGVHPQLIPNENFVHSLEHGAVAIVYQPTLDPADIARIEGIVGDFESHVISAPNETISDPIDIAAWGRMLRLDEFEGPTIRQFIDAFREKGPESQDCPATVDQPFGSQEVPSPTATIEVGGEDQSGDGGQGQTDDSGDGG